MFPLPSLKALREDFLDEIYHETVERIDQQLEKAIAHHEEFFCGSFECYESLADILYSKLKIVVLAINTRVLTDDANVAISNIPGSGNTLHDQMWHIEKKHGLSAIVTDNAANMWFVGCKFEVEFEDMWSVPCQCHALNLVLMSWASLDNIKQYLDTGKCIVQFVKNFTRVWNLLLHA
ncbi:hypothetical protein SELMODRAFT_417131 [Selaginella moellendorffii]|uniref:DUF659 domain-containing protein n=1 Tax=Selaginella moellendorffii TaxID=88036 RepID=D8S1G7_SELML|nr:hypothetical protein SELMODRAFT_417131 [Selaginella moellendorffii]